MKKFFNKIANILSVITDHNNNIAQYIMGIGSVLLLAVLIVTMTTDLINTTAIIAVVVVGYMFVIYAVIYFVRLFYNELHKNDSLVENVATELHQNYTFWPKDWQSENYKAAKFVVKLLEKYWDEEDEDLAADVHVAWLKRNKWAKGGNLDVPYAMLKRDDQEKYLLQISVCRKIMKDNGCF